MLIHSWRNPWFGILLRKTWLKYQILILATIGRVLSFLFTKIAVYPVYVLCCLNESYLPNIKDLCNHAWMLSQGWIQADRLGLCPPFSHAVSKSPSASAVIHIMISWRPEKQSAAQGLNWKEIFEYVRISMATNIPKKKKKWWVEAIGAGWLAEVRSIESQPHETTANKASDGNGHDPREQEQADSLPVDGFVGTVAETNTNSSSRDTHGCRDR